NLAIDSLVAKTGISEFDYLLWYDVSGGTGTYHNKILQGDYLNAIAGKGLVEAAGQLGVTITGLTSLGQVIVDADEFMVYDVGGLGFTHFSISFLLQVEVVSRRLAPLLTPLQTR
ncbi:MAG: hypothetical protein ACC742_13605, partial [Thermoanaerobaculales bacterium]